MSTTNATKEIILLNQGARINASKGNDLLASWMSESAMELEKMVRDTDNFLDKFLADSKARHNKTSHSKRNAFASDWYAYEDEYAYNFSME